MVTNPSPVPLSQDNPCAICAVADEVCGNQASNALCRSPSLDQARTEVKTLNHVSLSAAAILARVAISGAGWFSDYLYQGDSHIAVSHSP